MEGSTFVSDAELNRYLDEALTEFWDFVVAEQGMEFWLKNSTIASVAGTRVYALPSDYYLLLGVEVETGDPNDPVLLDPYMFKERYLGRSGAVHPGQEGWAGDAMYRVYSEVNATTGVLTHNIRFSVLPDGATTIRIWYIPHAPFLDGDADVLDGMNGWEECVVISAAIRCLEKEESDTSALFLRLELLKQRIKSIASFRDMGHPMRVWDSGTG